MNLPKISALVLGLSLFLASCGGGSTPTPPPPAETQLTEANAWKGYIPADAEMVAPDAFKAGLASGELVLFSTASLEAQKAAQDKQFRDDKTFLSGLPDKSPYVQALLEAASDLSSADGDIPTQVGGGKTVGLLSVAQQLRGAVEAYTRSQDPANALEAYTLSYAGLPDDLKAQADSPDSLKGKSLVQIQAAASKLDALLSSVPNLDKTRLDLEAGSASLSGGLSSQAVNAGNGMDNSGVCTPSGFVKKYWFPLKKFVSPIKDQGQRGTCWAFAAIGALESRERVQFNNPANLSEQFLVNKVKQDWDSSDDEDGYSSDKALETAVNKGQGLLSEGAWTYNPAGGRNYPNYANTCMMAKDTTGKPINPYTGTCSETAHESRRACTTVLFKFCSYAKVTFGGPGVASSRTNLVWSSGKKFDLNRYRTLLAQGYTLLADFPVYKGFSDAGGAGGIVSDYTTATSSGKKAGGHAVQLVGFLSNDDLTQFGNPSKVGGGGYFILKNSWGCTADGGYYYVPADYVQKFFGSLRTLNFDGRRSSQWTQEQKVPGGTEAPTIVTKNLPASADLRIETDLAQFFTVSHPVASIVNLTVTSSLDGTLYSGPWSTQSGGFGGPDLKRTFAVPGTRTINLLAKYGSSQVIRSFAFNVVNTPPTLSISLSGNPRQGEEFPISAQIVDPNESDSSKLCANTRWSVDAPDTLSSTSGCTVKFKGGAQGARMVRVSISDGDGGFDGRNLTLNVLPPSVNPYPKITYAGVYNRDAPRYDVPGCSTTHMIDGDTLTLTWPRITCAGAEAGPTVFYAKVILENPSSEALTYDWKLYVSFNDGEIVYGNSNQSVFNLSSRGGASPATFACRVTLTVGAPEPSRSKSLTVWTGRCTILFGTILK